MNKAPLTLSTRWQILTAIVLTFMIASPFQSMSWPHASKLQAYGHPGMAMYFTGVGVAFWFIALLILLPLRGNASKFTVVRGLGRLPMLARYFLALGVAAALFWLGIGCEKIIC